MTKQILTTTGASDSVRVTGNKDFAIEYTIAGSSTDIVVSVEASGDNANWFNADENGSTTQTADGTFAFTTGNKPYDFLRFNIVSGTFTTVTVIYMQGN